MGQVKRLKELEKENSRLKRLVAELSLEKQVLRDVAQGIQRESSSQGSRETDAERIRQSNRGSPRSDWHTNNRKLALKLVQQCRSAHEGKILK